MRVLTLKEVELIERVLKAIIPEEERTPETMAALERIEEKKNLYKKNGGVWWAIKMARTEWLANFLGIPFIVPEKEPEDVEEKETK